MQYIRQPLTHAIRAAPSFYWVALPAMARPVVVPVSIRALHITAPTRAAEDPNGLRNMLPPGFEKLYNSPGAVAAMKRMTELMVEKGFDPRKGEVPSTMQMLKLAANSDMRKAASELMEEMKKAGFELSPERLQSILTGNAKGNGDDKGGDGKK